MKGQEGEKQDEQKDCQSKGLEREFSWRTVKKGQRRRG